MFLSPAWVTSWVGLANADREFVAASHGWSGAVGAVVRVGGTALERPLHLRLDGADGHWAGYEVGTDPALVDRTVFTLTADYEVWRRVVSAELDPLRGLVQGRLRARGQLSSILRWAQPFRIMIRLAAGLDTEFVARSS